MTKPIGTPGPHQARILEALALALASGQPSLSSSQLAEILLGNSVDTGPISGALSGMRRHSNRHWVKELRGVEGRRWAIRPEGMAAILKLARGK